ncbi:MAG: hypothetical protein LBE36_03545 [Flavobacteriaceae bacterium]|jgi:predicted Mrr-cat superfamily restriction endonuclease|nr:hypothetical protein [Flavobacteriaceae bacterium]
MTETVFTVDTAEPKILSKIEDYIKSLNVNVEIADSEEGEYDPYVLTEEDLYHLQKSEEDIANGRLVDASEVYRKALEKYGS